MTKWEGQARVTTLKGPGPARKGIAVPTVPNLEEPRPGKSAPSTGLQAALAFTHALLDRAYATLNPREHDAFIELLGRRLKELRRQRQTWIGSRP